MPEVFYGSAIAALAGLAFGLMLHAGWRHHPGGPQILFRVAEAAERHNPTTDDQPAPAPAPTSVGTADLDSGHTPPAPLPVVRLRPDMFEVQPAAADEAERQDVDDLVADAAPLAPPRDLD